MERCRICLGNLSRDGKAKYAALVCESCSEPNRVTAELQDFSIAPL